MGDVKWEKWSGTHRMGRHGDGRDGTGKYWGKGVIQRDSAESGNIGMGVMNCGNIMEPWSRGGGRYRIGKHGDGKLTNCQHKLQQKVVLLVRIVYWINWRTGCCTYFRSLKCQSKNMYVCVKLHVSGC